MPGNPGRSIANRPVAAFLAIALALILSGCPAPDNDGDDCSCPNLEATVSSIDWVGDGAYQPSIEAGTAVSRYRLQVTVLWDSPDREAEQKLLAARFADAGFTNVDDEEYYDLFQGDDWQVHIQTGGTEDEPKVVVFVRIAGDDRRAAEILAPLVDALGTIP